jgi:hypothetical protein
MEELNAQLNKELLEAIKGEGEPIRFSPEEYQVCAERYLKLCEEESKMEAVVRKERVRSAATPAVYLTF